MRDTYPSDISCEKFEKIRLILESVRKKIKPRRLGLYELFCGVLYVLKSSCQWQMLPKEFPRWRNCYDYFKKWSKKTNEDGESVLEIVLKIDWREQWSEYQNKLLHYWCPKCKNTGNAEEKSYDAGKKNFSNKASYRS
ncbi:hypothetical protein wTkk_001069 [Wolbachia endosymbiont of Trichogramma kaykai]